MKSFIVYYTSEITSGLPVSLDKSIVMVFPSESKVKQEKVVIHKELTKENKGGKKPKKKKMYFFVEFLYIGVFSHLRF